MMNFAGRALRVLSFVLAAALAQTGAFAQDTEVPVDGEAAGAESTPALLDSRVTATPERARLVLDLTQPTEFAVYTRAEPDRVIVEVRAQSGPGQEDTPQIGGEGLVSGYSVESTEAGRVRASLLLAAPAQVQQSYILEAFEDQPARLVIDIIPDTEANFLANVRGAGEGEAEAPEPELDGQQMAPGETASAPAATRPLIVIDPGHGGADSGATSDSGIAEKNIVLAFALKLQSLLVATGRFEVALTRDTDVFLGLGERIGLARSNQADLFISLHADSFDQQDVRGASIYTRGELATSEVDRILAEQENRAALVAGYTPPDEEMVVDVLVDLLGRETRRESFMAGKALIEQLEPSIQLRRFPLRQAGFYVLQAPDVPSVLIELGFLSNTDDTQNLTTDAWLERVAAALARGVAIYFDDRG